MPTKEFQDTIQHFSSFLLDKGRNLSQLNDMFMILKILVSGCKNQKSFPYAIYGRHLVPRVMKSILMI